MQRIHLVNVGETNGGDLLMAMTAVARLRERLGPLAVTVNGRSVRDVSDLRVRSYGNATLRVRVARKFRRMFIRAPLASRYGSGDLVLDCNGYRHGGIWPASNLADDIAAAATIRARGARLVLLPKSCGPFDAGTGALFAQLAANADLVYCRDRESLRLCSPYTSRARLCPDFTVGSPGLPAAPQPGQRRGIVIIPNSKLVETGMFADFNAYARFIATCAGQLSATHRECRVLFHQARDVHELRQRLDALAVPSVFHDDPRAAKAELARAALVFSSRYHGMIGALTSGTPCLVLGWSHKYAGFLEFYPDGQQWLVPEVSAAAVAQRASWIGSAEHQAGIAQQLAAGNRDIALRSEAMWDEIAQLAGAPR
jgi:hypothetical protein